MSAGEEGGLGLPVDEVGAGHLEAGMPQGGQPGSKGSNAGSQPGSRPLTPKKKGRTSTPKGRPFSPKGHHAGGHGSGGHGSGGRGLHTPKGGKGIKVVAVQKVVAGEVDPAPDSTPDPEGVVGSAEPSPEPGGATEPKATVETGGVKGGGSAAGRANGGAGKRGGRKQR